MDYSFDAAFRAILAVEGGYVNDPSDPGGETKYGISKRAYPTLDIANLTQQQARDIYWQDYWVKCGCDGYPGRAAYFVFDCAVNEGQVFAVRLLQATLHLPVDGVAGPATKVAAQRINQEQLAQYLAKRAMAYWRDSNAATFGEGWIKRLFLLALPT